MNTKNTFPQNGEDMIRLMKVLWPINRSISGSGLRQTLSIIKDILPTLELHEVKSGTRVLDWVVPEEWEITEAYLEDPSGVRIADFKENNLHVLGYSASVDAIMPLEEVVSHIHSLPQQPEVIPYVTSYYQKNWGFCIAEMTKQSLQPGNYKAYINARHFQGSITYGEWVLPGLSRQEVFISTYCCHPSMANNELSGPCVAVALASWLAAQSQRKYTYRLVFAPETIGSAAYLHDHASHLKENVIAAFNLTCVGDERVWSFMPSRLGNTYADEVALHALQYRTKAFTHYNWNDRGSDERMYCSPLINLPMVSVMRSKYATYPEYHTSADTVGGVVTAKGLQESLDMHKTMITILEKNVIPTSLVFGEPQLGSRGLYPLISKKGSSNPVKTRLNFISYADGNHTLLEIAEKCEVAFEDLLPELDLLVQHQVLKVEEVKLEMKG